MKLRVAGRTESSLCYHQLLKKTAVQSQLCLLSKGASSIRPSIHYHGLIASPLTRSSFYHVSVCSNRGGRTLPVGDIYLICACLSGIMWAVCLNRPRDFSLFPSGSLLKRTWVISFNKLNSLLVYRSLHAILTLEQQFFYR